MITDRSNLKISYLESHQKRGVAGATYWLTPEAHRDDKLQLIALHYNYLHENGYTKLLINHRKSYELFTDPLSSYTKKGEHTVNGTNLKINHFQDFGILKMHFLVESKIESIESSDVCDHSRNTNSIATVLSIPIYDKLEVNPFLRYDFVEDITSNISKALGAIFHIKNNIQLEYQYSTGLRYPTFNDMYWNLGGNSDLKPELSQNHSLKFRWKLNKMEFLYLQVNDRYVEDLIKWRVGEDYWFSDNISESRHSSITFGLNTTLSNSPLQFSVNGTFQKAIDLELDKLLLNVPRFVFSTGITYSTPKMKIFFSEHLRNKTQYRYYFEEDNFLPDYFLFNTAIEYNLSIFNISITALFAVENIFNKMNESISGYPEPGRTLKVGLTYTL